MRLPSIFFKNRANNSTDHILHRQWQWPSCKKPDIINSVFSNPSNEILGTPNTCASKSTPEYTNISSESEDYYNCGFLKDETLETIIRGVQSSPSQRRFFEPEQTKLISKGEGKFAGETSPFTDSVAVVMPSKDPYGEFKKSMEEMIQSRGLKDLECLEKILGWYLEMNDKKHHVLILEAFVDVFLEFASSSSNSTSSFFSGEPSFSSSSSILSTGGQRGNR